jgi:Holliday junction DNA helicase RuvB
MPEAKSKLPLVELNHKAERGDPSGAPDNILRPRRLGDYVGQRAVVSKLEVFLAAARQRSATLDHVLLSGPPGLGKTTLAHIIAQEMGGRLHQAPGPTLDKSVDLLALLTNIQEGDVLFIDEVHRLSPAIEETLYPAMEDFQAQIVLGEGPSAQPVTVPIARFTLIGATTQPGKITGPLRDRFGIHLGLDFYGVPEMRSILRRSAGILGIELEEDEIDAIALRSRGTPRIGNRLLSRVRDFVQVVRDPVSAKGLSDEIRQMRSRAGAGIGGVEAVRLALEFLDVDARGLQPLDRRYLRVLMEQFEGGPAGVEALAASLAEDRSTLEETIEPYLLKEGFIVRRPRGRVATSAAYLHMGLKPIKGLNPEAELFDESHT